MINQSHVPLWVLAPCKVTIPSGRWAGIVCRCTQVVRQGWRAKGASLLAIIGEKLVACKAWVPFGNSAVR